MSESMKTKIVLREMRGKWLTKFGLSAKEYIDPEIIKLSYKK